MSETHVASPSSPLIHEEEHIEGQGEEDTLVPSSPIMNTSLKRIQYKMLLRRNYVFEKIVYPYRHALLDFKRNMLHGQRASLLQPFINIDEKDRTAVEQYIRMLKEPSTPTPANENLVMYRRNRHYFQQFVTKRKEKYQQAIKNDKPTHEDHHVTPPKMLLFKSMGRFGFSISSASTHFDYVPSNQLTFFVKCMVQSKDPSIYNDIYDQFHLTFDTIQSSVASTLFLLNEDCKCPFMEHGQLKNTLGYLDVMMKQVPLANTTKLLIPSQSHLLSSLMMIFGSVPSAPTLKESRKTDHVYQRVMTMEALELAMGLLYFLHVPNQDATKVHKNHIILKSLHLKRLVEQISILLFDVIPMQHELDNLSRHHFHETFFSFLCDNLGNLPTYRLLDSLEIIIGILSNMIDFSVFLEKRQWAMPCTLQQLDQYMMEATSMIESERYDLYADIFKEQSTETAILSVMHLIKLFCALHRSIYGALHHKENTIDYNQWPVIVTADIVMDQIRMFSLQRNPNNKDHPIYYSVFGTDYQLCPSSASIFNHGDPPKVLIGLINKIDPSQKTVNIQLISAHGFDEHQYIHDYLTSKIAERLLKSVMYTSQYDYILHLDKLTHPQHGIYSFTIPFPEMYLTQLTDYFEYDHTNGHPIISIESFEEFYAVIGLPDTYLNQFAQLSLTLEVAFQQSLTTIDQFVSPTGTVLPIPLDPHHYLHEEFGVIIDKKHPLTITALSPMNIQVQAHIRLFHLADPLPNMDNTSDPFLYFIKTNRLSNEQQHRQHAMFVLTQREVIHRLRTFLPDSIFVNNYNQPLDVDECPWAMFNLGTSRHTHAYEQNVQDVSSEGIVLFVPQRDHMNLILKYKEAYFDKYNECVQLFVWRQFTVREHTYMMQQLHAIQPHISLKNYWT